MNKLPHKYRRDAGCRMYAVQSYIWRSSSDVCLTGGQEGELSLAESAYTTLWHVTSPMQHSKTATAAQTALSAACWTVSAGNRVLGGHCGKAESQNGGSASQPKLVRQSLQRLLRFVQALNSEGVHLISFLEFSQAGFDH